jgi:hypothetical protein
MDRLVREGLCCTRKRLALDSWTGTSIPPTLPHNWGAEPAYAGAPDSQRFFVKVNRDISHVKMLLDDHGRLTAKAYLEFYPVAAGLA